MRGTEEDPVAAARPPSPRADRLIVAPSRAPLLGACLLVGVAVAVVVLDSPGIVVPLVLVGPLVAASGGRTRWTAGLGVAAVALSVPLAAWDDYGTARTVGVVVLVAAGSLLAWRLAAIRDEREHALRQSQPMIERSLRLAAAMTAGRMGEWSWDATSDRVVWDDTVCALFGLRPDEFPGTFDSWLERIDPRDRETAAGSVQAGISARSSFRFDHRVVWPDGSVHWLEGIGEPVLDRRGSVVGAAGLTLLVDDRYRELDQRNRLMRVESAARQRAEYLARVHDVLSRSVDTEEIVRRITEAAVPDLADWCVAVVSIDRQRDQPLIVVAHADPVKRDWARAVLQAFPYDPDADFGAASVIRTGETKRSAGVLSSQAMSAMAAPGAELIDQADADDVLTVPLVGPLGILGALQLIRGRERSSFGGDDLALVDELASRCGAALHTAVLFARQHRSRAALDTLQRVSGALAAAATFDDVTHSAVEVARVSIDACGAAVYVDTEHGIERVATQGSTESTVEATAAIEDLVKACVVDGEVLSGPVDDELSAAVAPLRILGRSTGALAFLFQGRRDLSAEERSMLFTLGSRCAGALERAALYERERDTALVLQRRLLPDLSGVPSWIDVAARYEPATGGRIGGDWFQLVEAGEGRLVAAVGDAVGHGMVSAAAMGQLRASIATAVSTTTDPAAALAIVDTFARQGSDTLGASAALVVIDQSGGLLHASAGHPPLVLVPADGPARLLDAGRSPLLGFGQNDSVLGSRRAGIEPFGPGDMLVMYSDGLVERRHSSIDSGLLRLVEALESARDLPPQEMVNELITQLEVEGHSEDDVALLVVRRLPSAPD